MDNIRHYVPVHEAAEMLLAPTKDTLETRNLKS